MRHLLLASSIAALLFGGLGSARADAVPPLPERCPEGSEGAFCHGPPRCAPLTCEIDTDCGSGMRCVERPLCVRDQSCGGGWSPSEPVPHVDGTCPGGTCEGFGASCESLKVCVAIANADGGAPRPDAGGSSPDGGGTPTDAGGTPTDGGSTPADAGGGTTDAGRDGGGARTDSGPSGQDAGGGGTTGGGCCSVVGARSGAGGALFAALILATALRRSRRR